VLDTKPSTKNCPASLHAGCHEAILPRDMSFSTETFKSEKRRFQKAIQGYNIFRGNCTKQ